MIGNRVTRIVVGVLFLASICVSGGLAGGPVALANPAAEQQQPAPTPVPAEPIAAAPLPVPLLIVRSFESNPRTIVAGKPFKLTLDIHNATNRRADNVLVSLGPAEGVAPGAAGLAIMGTGNAKPLGDLRGNRQAEVTFDVTTLAGTPAGALSVPVRVSFEFEGQRHEVAYAIGVMIERTPILTMISAEVPDSVMVGESFPAMFELANASGFALNAAKISVEASGATVTDGSFFIGNFEDAITESIESMIIPEEPGTVDVVLVLEYRDQLGNLQSWRETRTVEVQESAEFEDGVDPAAGQEADAEEHWLMSFFKSIFGLGG